MSSIESSNENIINQDDELSEDDLEKKRFEPYVKLPKWLRLILMFLPSLIIAGIIIAIAETVGFPENIYPTAIMALLGMSIFALVVLGDMAYRNVFVYKMLRYESRKSRIYKQIIKEKKDQDEKSRYDYEEDNDYEYDTNDEELEDDIEQEEDESEDEEDSFKEEYTYDLEDEREHFKLKSFILRGGIVTILIVNGILLIALAAIFQIALFGGFSSPTE